MGPVHYSDRRFNCILYGSDAPVSQSVSRLECQVSPLSPPKDHHTDSLETELFWELSAGMIRALFEGAHASPKEFA